MRDWSWLYELGYTNDEIMEAEENWTEDILDLLAEPIFEHEYRANAELMLQYFDREDLLMIMICHPLSFQTRTDIFRNRVNEMIRELGEGWYDLAYRQFWRDQGECVFDALWCSDEGDWKEALARLISFGETYDMEY